MKDYYQILEVEPDASQEQIKSQYRFLMQAWHPDKFSSPESKAKAEEKSKQINEAYNELGDPTKRKLYDQKISHSQKAQDEHTQRERERKQREKEAREKEEAQKRENEAKAQREARERADRERAKRAEEEQAARAKAQREAEEKSKPPQQPVYDRKPAIGTTAAKSSPFSLWQAAALVILSCFALFVGGLGARVLSPSSSAIATMTETVLKMPLVTTEVPVIATKTPLATTEVPVVAVETPRAVKEGLLAAEEAKMVLIPEGEFIMGSDNKEANDDEKPLHKVILSPYYIDQYEVTNAQYERCVDAGACNSPLQSGGSPSYDGKQPVRSAYYGNPEYSDYPVMYVDWNMANIYCSWRDARLPTEAEWEKAARGTNGYIYPWGNIGFDCSFANYFGQIDKTCVGDTTKVGSYESGKSPYGVYDMIGNVYEWVNDWYSETYYQDSPLFNPLGPDSSTYTNHPGVYRSLRGGEGDIFNENAHAASRNALPPDYAFALIGFRCARSP